MNYTIIKAEKHHIPNVISIFNEVYTAAVQANSLLPFINKDDIWVKTFIEYFNKGLGFIALKDGRIVGYIIGLPVKEFFGSDDGIFVPLFGHGSVKKDRQRIYQALYTYASGLWVEKGMINHLITLFCEDNVSVDTWLSLGFGNRCIDAIRSTEAISDVQELDDYSFIKADKKHLPDITQLCLQDSFHFKSAPSFMPGNEKSINDIMHDFDKWLSADNHHLWIAYEKEQAIGYIRIQENGESFISEYQDMMNITGAYVTNEYRGKGVAKYLLNTILAWLNKNGYSICGVDYESINVAGNNFWHKYFKPYTYSMVRHIDDRILK